MANAIKRISVMRGHDVTQYTLQCFGGAGGQHACQVADALGMTRVLIHPLAGVLSAYGVGLADQSAMREWATDQPLQAAGIEQARQAAARLGREAARELTEQGIESRGIEQRVRLHVRYVGTDTALIVDMPATADAAAAALEARAAFENAYRQRFAFLIPQQSLIIEAVGVEC